MLKFYQIKKNKVEKLIILAYRCTQLIQTQLWLIDSKQITDCF